MVSRAQLKSIALSMPEAQEKSHFGQPDFRVRNKIFANLARADDVACLKLPSTVQIALLTTRPDVFQAAEGAWGRSGWTYIQLPRVKPAELRTLVSTSWQLIAPKSLSAGQALRSPVRAESSPSKPRRR